MCLFLYYVEVMRKSNTLEFIEKSKNVHGDKYDYSKVEYLGATEKVCIICPEHGPFYQIPNSHSRGKGCLKCARKIAIKKTYSNTEKFIEKARKKHGNKYDYSKVEYIKAKEKVSIICHNIDEITNEKHGEFLQQPSNHLAGGNCPKCTGNYMTQELFIKRARVIHNNQYDYSKVEYKTARKKVNVICPEHGLFSQVPDSHIRGNGCPKCSNIYSPTTREWIEKAKKIHGNRYDYSKTVYKKTHSKVSIICKEHGVFLQTPANHLNGNNCPKCTGNYMDKSFFIQKANEIYKDKSGAPLYDYSLVDYVDSSTKVTIICHNKDPETGKEHGEFNKTPNTLLTQHGCPKCGLESLRQIKSLTRLSNKEFLDKAFPNEYEYLNGYKTAASKMHIKCKKCGHKFWQKANNHLMGAGCPACKMSRLERAVCNYLKKHNVKYKMQKRFEWLGRQSLDFYLPDFNMAIECQGIQHFEPKDFFGGDDELKNIVKRDNRKLKKCSSNNIEMVYVIDNEKYLEKKYHFDIAEPFSGNVCYKIMHINNFENYINQLVEMSNFFEKKL